MADTSEIDATAKDTSAEFEEPARKRRETPASIREISSFRTANSIELEIVAHALSLEASALTRARESLQALDVAPEGGQTRGAARHLAATVRRSLAQQTLGIVNADPGRLQDLAR